MKNMTFEDRVSSVRAFTRFYTRKAGVLNELLLDSNFGLTEARIMHELSTCPQMTAQELAQDLELDPAYISRVFKKFEKQGYISRSVSGSDRRKFLISLTDKGLETYQTLNKKSAQLFGELLHKLDYDQQNQLLDAMQKIEDLLDDNSPAPAPYVLRPHRPGDMGWIIQAHGRTYTEEYGWDETFEAMVAEIAAEFLKNFDEKSECCWMAEVEGQIAGSAMVVRADEQTAKLRLVIVDPIARGLGVGTRLVEECINFARRRGYKKMTLWTNDNLHAAIQVYKKLGFHLIEEEAHHSFGKDLIGQYWSLDLS